MLNNVQLIGNVGHDLEIRSTRQGVVVTSFNLATNRRYRDAAGERQSQTEWHRVVLWGNSAHNAGEILRKGSLVYIEGRLQTRSWEDRESGDTRYRTEVVGLVWKVLGQPGSDVAGEDAADAELPEVELEDDVADVAGEEPEDEALAA